MKCKHLQDRDKVTQRIDKYKGDYAIEGCCGGGCYIIMGIKYCPFCGEKLK